MKGIRNQGKNSWQIQVYIGVTDSEGKYQRHYETVHGSKRDAEKRRAELLVSLSKGMPLPANRLTVAEQLRQWLDGYAKTRCTQRTVDGYQSIIERHLIPVFGHLQLKDLQPPMIQRYYGEACARLSRRTVHYHHRVLSAALKYAVRQGAVGRNPCELVDPPSPKGKKMKTMTPGEVGHLLDIATESPYYPVIYTALNTGMRQAELLGLRWRDVDLDLMTISVHQVLYKRRGLCEFKEPKTAHSRRCIDMTPKLAQYLRSHRAERESFNLELGKLLTLDDLVFVSDIGEPIDAPALSHAFHTLAKRAGLDGVRFHDCRHTFASLMLLRGVSPKVVSAMLGHASAAFTMDTYQHIMDGMQKGAVAKLDELLPEGIPTRFTRNSRDFSEMHAHAEVAE